MPLVAFRVISWIVSLCWRLTGRCFSEQISEQRWFCLVSLYTALRLECLDEVQKRILKMKHLPAAFVLLTAAVFGVAQEPTGGKHNTRPEVSTPASAPGRPGHAGNSTAKFFYEFTHPEFYVRHITIEHDANGKGRITFERLRQETPIVESLEISAAAFARIAGLWQALGFLGSSEVYQSDRQFAHLGTMRLRLEQDERSRTVEFNWTKNQSAFALVTEYRRLADQAILVFDIAVARETQPLNGPKLMEELELQLKRNGLSDPHQLLPLLRDISTDEHLPLIARNHAARLIKKIEK